MSDMFSSASSRSLASSLRADEDPPSRSPSWCFNDRASFVLCDRFTPRSSLSVRDSSRLRSKISIVLVLLSVSRRRFRISETREAWSVGVNLRGFKGSSLSSSSSMSSLCRSAEGLRFGSDDGDGDEVWVDGVSLWCSHDPDVSPDGFLVGVSAGTGEDTSDAAEELRRLVPVVMTTLQPGTSDYLERFQSRDYRTGQSAFFFYIYIYIYIFRYDPRFYNAEPNKQAIGTTRQGRGGGVGQGRGTKIAVAQNSGGNGIQNAGRGENPLDIDHEHISHCGS